MMIILFFVIGVFVGLLIASSIPKSEGVLPNELPDDGKVRVRYSDLPPEVQLQLLKDRGFDL